MKPEGEVLAAFAFEAAIIAWRGPSPFFFVTVPVVHTAEIHRLAREVSYGWGVIPVEGRIGEMHFTTSLIPKNGGYLVPLRAAVRRAVDVTAGDRIRLALTLRAIR